MIKIKTTKQRIYVMVGIITEIVSGIKRGREVVQHTSAKRMEYAAHIFILEELSRKMRSKFVRLENQISTYKFQFSFNEMEAFVLMLYAGNRIIENDFQSLVILEIKEPIYKHLLNW